MITPIVLAKAKQNYRVIKYEWIEARDLILGFVFLKTSQWLDVVASKGSF